MNPRTTLVLALVAGLLAGVVFFGVLGGEADRQEAEENEKRVHPDLAAEAIDAIELTTQDGIDARFERHEGRWQLVRPVVAPADTVSLDAMAGALTSLVREGEVDSAASLEPFGLGESARVIRFEVAGATKGLRIGGSTPIGGHRYVAPLAQDAVSYVATYRVNAFDRNFADLRDSRFFALDAQSIDRVELAWPGAAISIERRNAAEGGADGEAGGAGDSWWLVEPFEAKADDLTLRELLTNLSFLSATDYLDEAGAEVDRAMSEQALEVRVISESGERTLAIGGDMGWGLAVRGPEGRFYTIAPERLDDFATEISTYRDRSVSGFEGSRARRLVMGFAREDQSITPVEAELVDAGWTGGPPSLDPDRAVDLVRDLSGLRAASIAADAMGPRELEALGLSPPRVSIRVDANGSTSQDAETLSAIYLGLFDEERGLYVQKDGAATVYLLDPDTAAGLPYSWERFQSDFEMTARAPADESAGESDLELDDLAVDPLEGVEEMGAP